MLGYGGFGCASVIICSAVGDCYLSIRTGNLSKRLARGIKFVEDQRDHAFASIYAYPIGHKTKPIGEGRISRDVQFEGGDDSREWSDDWRAERGWRDEFNDGQMLSNEAEADGSREGMAELTFQTRTKKATLYETGVFEVETLQASRIIVSESGFQAVETSDHQINAGEDWGNDGGNTEWVLRSVQVVEGGEVIEGLNELRLTTNLNLDLEPIVRISNMAKENSLALSEESFLGIGTRWPSVKLDVNGGVQGTSAYSAASDKRFKKNIKAIDGLEALEVVHDLKGVLFDWRDRPGDDDSMFEGTQPLGAATDSGNLESFAFDVHVTRNPGFIAQEVEAILPQIVTTGRKGYKSVKYSSIVPFLVEAIKELSHELSELKHGLRQSKQPASPGRV